MDPTRFDALTRAATSLNERTPTRRAFAALLAGGLLVVGRDASPADAAPRRKHRGKCKPKCGFNQVCQSRTCNAAPSVCPTPFVCTDPFGGPAPVCGHVAGDNGDCACVLTAEGNNVCVNETDGNGNDIDYTTLQTCTTSQDCRDTVGFHFFCLAVTTSPMGHTCGSDASRCWPECDNPGV